MGLALLLPRCIQSLVGRAPGPVGLALESRGICSGQASGPNIFLGWARPENSKRPSSQAKKIKILERFQAGGPAQYILTAIPNHRPSI